MRLRAHSESTGARTSAEPWDGRLDVRRGSTGRVCAMRLGRVNGQWRGGLFDIAC